MVDTEEATVEDVKPEGEEEEEETPPPAHKRHHHHHHHKHHKHHHHHSDDDNVCTDRQNCPAPAAEHNKFTVRLILLNDSIFFTSCPMQIGLDVVVASFSLNLNNVDQHYGFYIE